MYIISWNVASLGTLVNRVHESYSPAENSNKSSNKASVAMHEFMSRHGADIYCLQEHKIPLTKLKSRGEPRGCSTVEGYESFWSCCVDKDKQGFNGVVTYAKQGLVHSANASPLDSKDLDDQGRCIMTDHGRFVLFNVYVPASGGQPLQYKMKFLNALRRAMQQQRKQKPVILVGDLNIKHTVLDRPWKDRVIHVDDILEEVASCADVASIPEWKRQVAEKWSTIVKALETKTVIPAEGRNPLTGEPLNGKYRLVVTLDNGRRVHLGKNERSEEGCTYSYEFGECHYVDLESGEECMAKEANVLTLEVLTELMEKIAGVKWDDTTQRLISTTCAGVRRIDPTRQWMDSLIQEDGMVDTFRHFYPKAEGRFTCWDQSTNRRYENEGVRLDYMLVDASLLQYVLKGDVPTLHCGGTKHNNPLGEEAARLAATANGAFKPASMAGGGILAASQRALDTQFVAPHTGIIYTPPSFSDHVGVSLLLKDDCCQRDLDLDESDAATRRSQPHKGQKLIASFVQQSTTVGRTKSSASLAEKFAEAAKKSKQKRRDEFFAPRGRISISESRESDASKRPKLGR